MPLMLPPVHRGPSLRHGRCRRHRSRLREAERDRKTVALLQGLLQPRQHDVIAARRERHRLAGFDRQRSHRPHFHHAMIVDALMHGSFGGDRRCDAGQSVRRASVGDGQVDGSLMPGRCRARPDVIDLDSRLIGEGGEGHDYQDGGEERSHGSLPLQIARSVCDGEFVVALGLVGIHRGHVPVHGVGAWRQLRQCPRSAAGCCPVRHAACPWRSRRRSRHALRLC